MSKLSVIKIERLDSKDYVGLRIECFAGEDAEEADYVYTKVVFQNQMGMMYRTLNKVLKDDDVWECDETFSNCPKINGDAARMLVAPHYRWEMKGDKVKVDKDRIIRFVKLVALGHDTLEGEMVRYKSQVPAECWIDEEEAED